MRLLLLAILALAAAEESPSAPPRSATTPEVVARGGPPADSQPPVPPIFLALMVGRDDPSAVEAIAAVKAAIADGSDINEPSPKGQTPLFNAVLQKRAPMVEFLLRAGADPLAENSAGFSMLDAACFGGNAHAVPLLVAAGVDPLKAGRDGNGPFARATWGRRDEHAATVAAFLAAVPSLKVAETFTVKGTPGKKDEVKVPEPVYLACENDATKRILGARVAEQSVAARRGPLAAPPGSTFSVEAYDYDAAKSQTTITFAVAGPQGEAREPLTVTLATTPEGGTAPPEHPEL